MTPCSVFPIQRVPEDTQANSPDLAAAVKPIRRSPTCANTEAVTQATDSSPARAEDTVPSLLVDLDTVPRPTGVPGPAEVHEGIHVAVLVGALAPNPGVGATGAAAPAIPVGANTVQLAPHLPCPADVAGPEGGQAP